MTRMVWAAGLVAVALWAFPVAAQDGTAALEQSPTSGAVLDGPNPNATDVPNNPNVGPVTHLPMPRFVTLKGNQGNARRGPGLTHRIDWVFSREGMPLKITGEYEHWRRVEDVDGAGGWVHYSLLSGVRSVLVTGDMAQSFSKPDDQADVVFQSELGVVGKLLQCVPDWCRIQVEGQKGWVRRSALWGVSADETYP